MNDPKCSINFSDFLGVVGVGAGWGVMVTGGDL